MSGKRVADITERTWFRTDRMTKSNGQWYFHTREKAMEGPFPSQFDALIQLDRYIKVQISGLLAVEKDKYSMAPH